MKKLSIETVGCPAKRPVRILQFGEGNFLRAFVDWQIDIANQKGATDMSVAIIPPKFAPRQIINTLQEQDFLYHVCLEGIENGKPKCDNRLITCVSDAFAPSIDYEKYMQYVTSPDLRFVVSNTTEAGIRYETDNVFADIPATFPGKVTNLLWHRFNHFKGDLSKGLIFLCCELIEDNGTQLRNYVFRHAEEAGLGLDFTQWVTEACIFADTLVDRIVPGFPTDNIDEIKAELGYDDNAVVTGELYHLWVIGGKDYKTVAKELPLDKAGLNVTFMPSIKEFRERKVRVLNGSHTGMVPVALQMGCETVMDAFNNPGINRFINDMVTQEVLPVIDGEPSELKAFSNSILERFYNPYIKHYLNSIALNSLAKWEARNWGTVLDNHLKRQLLAEREIFTFAALLSLYAPGNTFKTKDNAGHIALIANMWNKANLEETVRRICSSGIFLENFDEKVPGFTAKTTEYLHLIQDKGMEEALKTIFL